MTHSPRALNFERTGCWARAEANGIIVKPYKGEQFAVRLTDSEDSHICSLTRDDADNWEGYCSCRGFKYHNRTCTHLWALRIADQHNAVELPDETPERPPSCPQCGRVYSNYHETPEV